MSDLESCMDGIDVIFKLATFPSFISTFPKQFQVLTTVKNPSHGSGWDRNDLQTGNFR